MPAAGGHIVRDLFDAEHGGYFDNLALLNRLVAEKLESEAGPVRAEGWKWVIVTPEFHYALASGMRRVYPDAEPLSDENQAKLDALESEHEALSVQYADENPSEEIAAKFERLEAEIEALRQERYRPEDIAICGAFVSLNTSGWASRGARISSSRRRADAAASEESKTVPEKHDDPGRDSGPDGDGGIGEDTASPFGSSRDRAHRASHRRFARLLGAKP